MEVIYNNKKIYNNEFLKVTETQIEPEIKLNVNSSKMYLLIMYDPDAIVGDYIHWLVTNINENNVKNGINVIAYKGPSPPSKTGKHRYIFELYEQSNKSNYVDIERNISISNLRKILGVNNILYKIQFISQNESGGKSKKRRNRKNKKTRKGKY